MYSISMKSMALIKTHFEKNHKPKQLLQCSTALHVLTVTGAHCRAENGEQRQTDSKSLWLWRLHLVQVSRWQYILNVYENKRISNTMRVSLFSWVFQWLVPLYPDTSEQLKEALKDTHSSPNTVIVIPVTRTHLHIALPLLPRVPHFPKQTLVELQMHHKSVPYDV